MSRTKVNRSVDQIEGEDLVLFINACFTCTQQKEFYDTQLTQTLSIDFLHEYILGNYRRLYALTLASGINHFNKCLVIQNLLSAGSPEMEEDKAEEAALIKVALQQIPVNRVFNLFGQLKKRRVNNRRTRAVIKRYLESRNNLAFDAVKYRSKLRNAILHAHIKIPHETGAFLFDDSVESFVTPIFDSFRRAKYSQQAIYGLPYTVAESFAQRHGVPRPSFLKKIEGNLTQQERLRLQASAAREKKTAIDLDFGAVSLTKLLLYWLSLDVERRLVLKDQFESALGVHATKLSRGTNIADEKIALVADRSYSMWGSSDKKRRPLAIVFGIHQILRRVAKSYGVFWSTPVKDAMNLTAAGQTNIVGPFIEALKAKPDVILIVSDGYENDPTGLTGRVYDAWRGIDGIDHQVRVLHLNPVYHAESYDVKPLSNNITSVGIRNVEDLPVTLEYGRFASGQASLGTLEKYLRGKLSENEMNTKLSYEN